MLDVSTENGWSIEPHRRIAFIVSRATRSLLDGIDRTLIFPDPKSNIFCDDSNTKRKRGLVNVRDEEKVLRVSGAVYVTFLQSWKKLSQERERERTLGETRSKRKAEGRRTNSASMRNTARGGK